MEKDSLLGDVCCLETSLLILPKVSLQTEWPIRAELILVPVELSDLEYIYSPLLLHHGVIPNIIRWYPCLGEMSIVIVKCLAQQHNTMPPGGIKPGPLDPESTAPTILAAAPSTVQ